MKRSRNQQRAFELHMERLCEGKQTFLAYKRFNRRRVKAWRLLAMLPSMRQRYREIMFLLYGKATDGMVNDKGKAVWR
jgi:hypothetical protein